MPPQKGSSTAHKSWILSNGSYELLNPQVFMTILTSHTSFQRNQVKRSNKGNAYIFTYIQ